MNSVTSIRCRPWPSALASCAVLLVLALPGRASACSEASTSIALERCLLAEAGLRANLDNHFDAADARWRRLRELDPSDPAPALYEIETAWARFLYDEGVTAYDATIRQRAGEAIRLAERRLERDPDDPIALYRLGDALLHRARIDGLRRKYLSAGRDGERGRAALERALALRPDMHEIKYPLGLYLYYTSTAPKLLRWVRWLPFVPDGDAARGRRLLTEVRDAGGRHSVDAAFILMNIETYHAPLDLPSALAAGLELHARHPGNTLFHSELIETQIKIGHYADAIETAKRLEAGPVLAPEARGRPLLARILRAQATLLDGRPDEAWQLLKPLDPETSVLPSWGGAWLRLVRGQIHDVRGERSEALALYDVVTRLEGARYSERAALIAQMCKQDPVTIGGYEERPMVGARSH